MEVLSPNWVRVWCSAKAGEAAEQVNLYNVETREFPDGWYIASFELYPDDHCDGAPCCGGCDGCLLAQVLHHTKFLSDGIYAGEADTDGGSFRVRLEHFTVRRELADEDAWDEALAGVKEMCQAEEWDACALAHLAGGIDHRSRSKTANFGLAYGR